ncbi:Hypothetical_protein [Hexamita inflata]|uniref:Hypothetical_protein n=1 Tax=Hexamita inflata TaxID=28002 RepID=A0AA86PWH6_9EUKA|nr:Hypothetical protein HINF_LOCUS33958 [Hexamita inflata]
MSVNGGDIRVVWCSVAIQPVQTATEIQWYSCLNIVQSTYTFKQILQIQRNLWITSAHQMYCTNCLFRCKSSAYLHFQVKHARRQFSAIARKAGLPSPSMRRVLKTSFGIPSLLSSSLETIVETDDGESMTMSTLKLMINSSSANCAKCLSKVDKLTKYQGVLEENIRIMGVNFQRQAVRLSK